MARTSKAPITSLAGVPDDQLLTAKDVASVLKIHVSTATDWIVTGKFGEFNRVGERGVRIAAGVVRAYIASTRRPFNRERAS